MSYRLAVIPGDGIGPEVISVGLKVLERISEIHKFDVQWEEFPFGGDHYLTTGEVLSDESLKQLSQYDAMYLGAVGTPDVPPGILEKGLLLKIRFAFDQYINLRPVKLYPGVETILKNASPEKIDYIVVRENTGGLYTGVGGNSMKGTPHEIAIQSMVYNAHQVERCLRYAFEQAQKRRKKIALVGKSNVLTYVFDLWLRLYEELGKEYPEVEREYYHVDATCIHMLQSPERFDVIVTTNMFGDIITDLAAVTQGGIGLAASGNINPEKNYPSMFEPVHGSAPDIAGQNKANPLATVLTLKLLLEFLGEEQAAAHIEELVATSLQTPGISSMSTTEIETLLLNLLSR